MAERAEEELPTVLAYWARGFILHYQGRLAESADDHGRVISLYDRTRDAHLAFVCGMDVAVSSLVYSGVTLWCLGYPEKAQEYCKRGLALARDSGHPASLAHALTQAAQLSDFLRDTELQERYADELFRHSTEHGVMLFRYCGILYQGLALSDRGRHEEAIERIREAHTAGAAAGSTLAWSHFLAQASELYTRAGDLEKALSFVSEAVSMVRTGEEGLYDSEVYRYWGELLLERTPDSATEAETSFRRAMEVARGHGAKSLELRAALPLSRLLQSRGRRDEARELLAELYGWFTEGLDTPDLEDAAALLDELS